MYQEGILYLIASPDSRILSTIPSARFRGKCTFKKYGFVNSSLRTASQLSCNVSISSLYINKCAITRLYFSNSFCGFVKLLIHASLSKRTLEVVWISLPPIGDPKKAARDPCLSFFGADGEAAEDREDVAFLLTFAELNMIECGRVRNQELGAN